MCVPGTVSGSRRPSVPVGHLRQVHREGHAAWGAQGPASGWGRGGRGRWKVQAGEVSPHVAAAPPGWTGSLAEQSVWEEEALVGRWAAGMPRAEGEEGPAEKCGGTERARGWGELGAGAQEASGEEGRVQVPEAREAQESGSVTWGACSVVSGGGRAETAVGVDHPIRRFGRDGRRGAVRKEAYVLQSNNKGFPGEDSMAVPQKLEHRMTHTPAAASGNIPKGADSGHAGMWARALR